MDSNNICQWINNPLQKNLHCASIPSNYNPINRNDQYLIKSISVELLMTASKKNHLKEHFTDNTTRYTLHKGDICICFVNKIYQIQSLYITGKNKLIGNFVISLTTIIAFDSNRFSAVDIIIPNGKLRKDSITSSSIASR